MQGDLQRVRNVYKGGQAAIEELIPRIGETPTQRSNRWAHYRNVPVTKSVIRTLSWLVYGKPPSIDVWIGDKPPGARAQLLAQGRGEELPADEASDEYSQWVQDTFEQNRKRALMLNAGTQRIRDGRGPVKVWGVNEHGVPVEPFKRLRLDLHKTEDVRFVYDPGDPGQLLAHAEFRGGEGWLLWTPDEIMWVNEDFSYKKDAGAHPIPGYLPIIPFGDGEPMVQDLPDYQKVLINSQSTRWAVERATAFPIGVSKGKPANQADRYGDGTQSVSLGGGMTMLQYEDPQGGFTLVSPDADVAELRESYKLELEEAMSLAGGIPPESGMSAGTGPEQPTTVALKWLRAFIVRDGLILEAEEFEDNLQRVLAAYGDQYGGDLGLPSFSAEAADWDITFPKNPLPHDDRADKELAMKEILSGVRLDADYMREFVYPDATAEELAQIIEALKAAKAASQPSFGFGEAPEFEEGDEL